MVVHGPFVRWDIIAHASSGCVRAGVYYLETAQGERAVCAAAIPCEGNNMIYRAFDAFLEEYRSVIPSFQASGWNFRFQLGLWLNGIVYYSFLQHSEEGVGNCWHLASVGPPDVSQQLPQGLRQYFRRCGSATWILLVHGYKIWPVEVTGDHFGDGWGAFCNVHQLKPGFKVILACEHSWIFHTVILDENDREVRFHWSSPNLYHQQLHLPLRMWKTILRVSAFLCTQIIVCFRKWLISLHYSVTYIFPYVLILLFV